METPDIRWIQRFQNYRKALNRLRQAVLLSQTRELSDLEKQGLIQAFEFTHELALKTLKDYLEHQGITGLTGSRDATRIAFQESLIENGEVWMNMIDSINLTLHTYEEKTAEKVAKDILQEYFEQYVALEAKMNTLSK